MPCSADSVLTGNAGKVEVDDTLVARCTEWEVNPTVEESAWGDSDSAGYTNRVAGRKDCTGSFGGRFDNDDEVYDLFMPGDTVELTLWQSQTPANYWQFPCALITNYTMAVNMDTKEAVAWSADFGADGIFYRPGQSGAPSESYPS